MLIPINRNFSFCLFLDIISQTTLQEIKNFFPGGWSKEIYCIFDAKDDDDRDTKCWEQKHVDDIQCITKVGSFIVSADYDGDIIFWHSDTCRFAFRYNVNETYCSMQAPQPLEFNEKVTDVIGWKMLYRSLIFQDRS